MQKARYITPFGSVNKSYENVLKMIRKNAVGICIPYSQLQETSDYLSANWMVWLIMLFFMMSNFITKK